MSKEIPSNVTITRNEFLASDEWPDQVSFCGVLFSGSSPEHCFELIAEELKSFTDLKARIAPCAKR